LRALSLARARSLSLSFSLSLTHTHNTQTNSDIARMFFFGVMVLESWRRRTCAGIDTRNICYRAIGLAAALMTLTGRSLCISSRLISYRIYHSCY
jgi:hypothetical protein